jgi:hypothetical protein
MSNGLLNKEIESLPIELRKEVVDFVDFLKRKYQAQNVLKEREFGYAKGRVRMSKDFDEPLEEFKEYM